MTRLILASASASRAGLLAAAGVSFEILPARVDEGAVKTSLLADGADAVRVAEALAELKALRISALHPDALVLGADQVLVFGDELVSKSASVAEARAQLDRLRGQKHHLIGAAVLARAGTSVWRHIDRITLWMRPFSDGFLEDYLAREGDAAVACVGCYRLEGAGAQLFSKIDGDYFSILGLPLIALLAALREHGVIAS
jgi:septum formation protein